MSYHRPDDLTQALDLIASTPAKIIAGGTDVYPAMAKGQTPPVFLDLTRVPELSGIHISNGQVRIGAAATWTDIIKADLPPAFDGLKAAAREVGSVQIQNAGTIAGNLCNASPAADGVPPLLTLDAAVEIASASGGVRAVPLGAFITGVRETALLPGEIVTAILIPPTPTGAHASFSKLGSRRYLVISITMTAVMIVSDDSGRVLDARIAVGACSPVAQRLSALETALVGQSPSEFKIDAQHLGKLTPIDDIRGTASYRLDAIAEQIQRTVIEATQ